MVDADPGIAEGYLSECEAENVQLRAQRDSQERQVSLLLETNREQSVAIEKMEAQISELTRRVVVAEPTAEAARVFVEWHQKGQPGTPGTLYPFTYAQRDAWQDEREKRLSVLIAAVAGLDADVRS